MQISPRVIYQVLFLLLIILLGWLIWRELNFLLGAFLGAITLSVLLHRPMEYLCGSKGWKPEWATVLLLSLSVVLLAVPFTFLSMVVAPKIQLVVDNFALYQKALIQVNDYVKEKTHFDVLSSIDLSGLAQNVTSLAQQVLSGTFNTLSSISFALFFAYFLLVGYRSLDREVPALLPFSQPNRERFLRDFNRLVFGNAVSIPLIALAQGLVATVGYFFFGVSDLVLMGTLTTITSVIPVVGAAIVYVPLGIYQLAIGETWQGIALLAWGFLVVSSVDNVARIFLQKYFTDTHPVVIILGVIAGTSLFGLMGLIFGPILLALFLMLMGIYHDEFVRGEK